MLGKLLKHEWRAVWKVPMLLIGILMVIAAVAGLTFALPIWESEWVGLPLSGMMLIFMFYFAMIAAAIGITIYFAVRYYRNMFTDEGYLTHTLPISARQHLLNKTITMTAWNLIGGAAIIISIFIFFGTMTISLLPKDSSFAREILEGIRVWPELLDSPYMEGFQSFCVSIICVALVGAFSNAMLIIGSINLGQLFRKHRVLGAVGAYFGILAAIWIAGAAVMVPVMVKVMDLTHYRWDTALSPFPIFTPIYFIMAGMNLLLGVGLYFLSEYLLRNHLELE